jgi:hypothetical protein
VTGNGPTLERRLRASGILIALGLLVEALSLVRIHPLAFLAFMFVGGGLFVTGMAVFLYWLVCVAPADGRDATRV